MVTRRTGRCSASARSRMTLPPVRAALQCTARSESTRCRTKSIAKRNKLHTQDAAARHGSAALRAAQAVQRPLAQPARVSARLRWKSLVRSSLPDRLHRQTAPLLHHRSTWATGGQLRRLSPMWLHQLFRIVQRRGQPSTCAQVPAGDTKVHELGHPELCLSQCVAAPSAVPIYRLTLGYKQGWLSLGCPWSGRTCLGACKPGTAPAGRG